jgi:lipopolysaccharide biosynthesis glycosyltransferase
MLKFYGRKVNFYPIDGLMDELKDKIKGLDTGRFRITTLARLLMGSILPDTVTKVLYLDCDTVVLRNISSLYNMRLNNCIAAMAAEPTIYPEVKEILGLTAEDTYYNAGMILMNLSLWRSDDKESDCFNYYNTMGGRLPFNDQDILNYVLKDRIKRVGQTYDFITNYYYFRYSTLVEKSSSYAEGESRQSFNLAKHHPHIVHYASDERPWNRGNFNHYSRAYEKYLRLTPFAEAKKAKGKELYMAAYHMMNVVTFVAPAVRQYISDRYYNDRIKE